MSLRKMRLPLGLGIAALFSLGLVGKSSAEGPVDLPPSNEPRVPVARVVESAGLVASQGTGEPFQRLLAKDAVHSRDLLVVLPGLHATLEPGPKSVSLDLKGNLPGLSDSPVLESAVILHDSRAYDLDFTLVRGRVVLTNNKAKGPATVWLRAMAGVTLTLPEPGDSVALEVYGRWRQGIPFSLKNTAAVGPTVFWEINVLKGNVDLKSGKRGYGMSAPPGPSFLQGDSISGPDTAGPQRRTKVPSWADPAAPQPAEAKLVAAVVEAYRNRLKFKGAGESGIELLLAAEKDPDKDRARETRRLYIHAQAAMDNIDVVSDNLEYSKHDDVRQTAVIALRHWIGAAPGRDAKLYQTLLDLAYSKAEAETILQLLHSPFNPDLPETYETLIAYLRHSRMSVRELAAWHLYRLAPVGRDIPYNANAPAAERAKAAEAWKKLIPSGELPPEPMKAKPKGDAATKE